MKWFFGRLQEPSTFASLSALIGIIAGGIGGAVPWEAAVGGGLAAVAGIFRPEGGTGARQ